MTSGVPKTPTMTARVPRPPTTPQMGERQPRVLPTARTIVKASTHSTTLATKAGTAAMARVARAAPMSVTSPYKINYYKLIHVHNLTEGVIVCVGQPRRADRHRAD